MANKWCRFWHGLPNDPKWRTISRISKQRIGDVIAVFNHMLDHATANATERKRTQTNANERDRTGSNERGRIDGFNCEDVATALDLETGQVEAIVRAMEDRVVKDGKLTGWEKRQPIREDGSADRGKDWREAKKEERKRTQTNANERDRTLDKIRLDNTRLDINNPPTPLEGDCVSQEIPDEVFDLPNKSPENYPPDEIFDDPPRKPSPKAEKKKEAELIFPRFWERYPKKVGKVDALKVWLKISPDEELLAKILRSLELFKKWDGWTKQNGKFIQEPARWLNGRRWEDDLETKSEVDSNAYAYLDQSLKYEYEGD